MTTDHKRSRARRGWSNRKVATLVAACMSAVVLAGCASGDGGARPSRSPIDCQQDIAGQVAEFRDALQEKPTSRSRQKRLAEAEAGAADCHLARARAYEADLQPHEALEELDAGPLGLSIADAVGIRNQAMHDENDIPARDEAMHEAARAMNAPRNDPTTSPLPSAFVMQMDGIGSYLVFRDARLTIGPISSSARPTLGLMAEPDLPVISIERIDADYFVRSERVIEVNGTPVTEKLLADGDVIALSPRCRLRFRLPNAASTTAVLMLSGARLGRPDIRHVLLMGRDILAGPYTNHHIQSEHLDETITFFEQNERLLCRASQPVAIDGRPMQPEKGLMMDKPIRIGNFSMVLAGFHA